MAINRTPTVRPQTTAAADQARRAGDAQQNAAAKEGTRQAQKATTYNGTLFTNTNQAQNSNQAAQRKFASLARNRKRANVARARRNNVGGAGDDDGDASFKQDDMDALNGGRGGGGGRGREQEQDDTPVEAGQAGGAGADAQAGGPRPASAQAAPPSALDAIAAKFGEGQDAQRAEAVRTAWNDAVVKLRATAGAADATPWAATLAAAMIDLQQIEMKIGHVNAGGIAALRELALAGGPSTGSQSFNMVLPLVMLRAEFNAGKQRRARGGAIQQSVKAGIVGRAVKGRKTEEGK
jgi:type III secretion regulatory protein HpaA